MKILAIDPGPEQSAIILWDGKTVLDKQFLDNGAILNKLEDSQYFFAFKYDLLAIETIQCFGMPAGEEMFMTMFWVGRFVQCQQQPYRLIKRSEVKMALCGSMRAKDANIRQSLIDRFGKPGSKHQPGTLYGISNHLWSAMAIAVVTYDKETK